ncbi:hypothetical protein CY34DRAFT_801452 [Suillus luteus UH-Slu-Lm8-n1]|uniref:Uncharacterized protein n=1 Tax=Suillus luteus UH-Slu-Lm8-n1 TaxID=930992 RepID=A0A0D0AV64_9AGAM|nr:hypothetical protein CY34DRAFT_801452 [Suillus luteus UH-Slu-Lm8-n1]
MFTNVNFGKINESIVPPSSCWKHVQDQYISGSKKSHHSSQQLGPGSYPSRRGSPGRYLPYVCTPHPTWLLSRCLQVP